MTDPITLSIVALFAAAAILEVLRPGHTFPKISWWRLKGVAFFIGVLFLAEYPALLWDDWFAAHRIFDATGLGHVGGAIVGFVVFQFVLYVWHRTVHHFDVLFRWSHQMHHSAERLDVFGAFYFSPIDVASLGLVSSISLVWILGVTAPAAIAASLAGIFCTVFQHMNVRTPRWLGYLIQRPESHAVHHQRGLHAYNYADLPLVDMLFGTFRNPTRFEGECGYWDGASKKMLPMLVGRDVSEPTAESDGEPAVRAPLAPQASTAV